MPRKKKQVPKKMKKPKVDKTEYDMEVTALKCTDRGSEVADQIRHQFSYHVCHTCFMKGITLQWLGNKVDLSMEVMDCILSPDTYPEYDLDLHTMTKICIAIGLGVDLCIPHK